MGVWGAVKWPDATAAENWVQSCDWYYADWPYIDDLDRNREMIGRVRELNTDNNFIDGSYNGSVNVVMWVFLFSF